MKTKKILIVLIFISLFVGLSRADSLFIGSENIYAQGEEVAINAKLVFDNGTAKIDNMTVKIYNSTAKSDSYLIYNTTGETESNGLFTVNYTLDGSAKIGEYAVTAEASSASAETNFKVVSESLKYSIFLINSSSIINITTTKTSDLPISFSTSEITSKSGTYHYGNITIGQTLWHVLVTDPYISGQYEMVYMDDDSNMNLTNKTEDSGQGENYTEIIVEEFAPLASNKEMPGKPGFIKIQRDGNKLFAVSPPEKPFYSAGQTIHYIVLVENNTGLLEGSKSLDIDHIFGATSEALVSDVTNSFGFYYGNTSFSSIGEHYLIINDGLSAAHIRVESFLAIPQVTDMNGNPVASFSPGAEFIFKAFTKDVTKNPVLASAASVKLTYPNGTTVTKTMDRESGLAKAAFILPDDAPEGKYSLVASIAYEGVTKQVSTGFSVESSMLMVMPMNPKSITKNVEFYGFAPGDKIYIVVVKFDISTGFPYDIDSNISDATDECAQALSILELSKEGTDIPVTNLNITTIYSFANSAEFPSGADVPPEIVGSCIIRFDSPNMTGELDAKIKYDKGGIIKITPVGISMATVFAKAYPVDDSGEKFWFFTPGQEARLKISVFDVVGDSEIAPENITDVKVIELRDVDEGRIATDEISNISVVNGTLVFIAPAISGTYQLKFNFKVRVSGAANETGAGIGWFETRKYSVWAQPAGGKWLVGRKDNVTLTVTVIEPKKAFSQSSQGPSGVFVKPEEIWNNMLFKEVSFSEDDYVGGITTNGTATVTISPPGGEWESGYYGIKLIANDTDGTVSKGWGGFEIRDIWIEIAPYDDTTKSWGGQFEVGSEPEFLIFVRKPMSDELLDVTGITISSVEMFKAWPPKKVAYNSTITLSKTVELEGNNITLPVVALNDLPNEEGGYRLMLKVTATKDGSSVTDIGESWFALSSYLIHSNIAGEREIFAKNETVSIFVQGLSFDKTQQKNITNVTIQSLFAINKGSEVTDGISETVVCEMNCTLNFTLPNLTSGEYYVQFYIYDNESSMPRTDGKWFMVKNYIMEIPWIDRLWTWADDITADVTLNDIRDSDQCNAGNERHPQANLDNQMLRLVDVGKLEYSYDDDVSINISGANLWMNSFNITWNGTDFTANNIPAVYNWSSAEKRLYFCVNQQCGEFMSLENYSSNFTRMDFYCYGNEVFNATGEWTILPVQSLCPMIYGYMDISIGGNGFVKLYSFPIKGVGIECRKSEDNRGGLTNLYVNDNGWSCLLSNTTHLYVDYNESDISEAVDFSDITATAVGETFVDEASGITMDLDNITKNCDNCPLDTVEISAEGPTTVCFEENDGPGPPIQTDLLILPQEVYDNVKEQRLAVWAKTYPGERWVYDEMLNQWGINITPPSKIYFAANATHIWASTTTNISSATAKAVGENITDNEGGLWRVNELYLSRQQSTIALEGINVLSNGFKINVSLSKSGKFRLMQIVSESELGMWNKDGEGTKGYDINGDSDYDDTYFVLITDSLTPKYFDTVIIRNTSSVNFSGSTILNTNNNYTQRTFNNWHFLSIDANGRQAMFYEEAFGEWADFGSQKINALVTIPVILITPDAQGVANTTIIATKAIKKNGVETVIALSGVNATTNSKGIAELTVNFSEAAEYLVALESQTSPKEKMEEWKWPRIDVKGFVAESRRGKAIKIDNFEESAQTVVGSDKIKPFFTVNSSKWNWWESQGCAPLYATGVLREIWTDQFNDNDSLGCGVFVNPPGQNFTNNQIIYQQDVGRVFFLYNPTIDKVFVKNGNCNFTNAKNVSVGESVNISYSGWWGEPVQFELLRKNNSNCTKILLFGLELNDEIISSYNEEENEDLNEYRWFGFRVNLNGTVYTGIIADNKTKDQMRSDGADSVYITHGYNFSGSSAVYATDQAAGGYFLMNVITPWDRITFGNGSIPFALPEESQDNTGMLVAQLDETTYGDFNNDNDMDSWTMVVFDSMKNNRNQYTRVSADDDNELMFWDREKNYYDNDTNAELSDGNFPREGWGGNIEFKNDTGETPDESRFDILEYNNVSNYMILHRWKDPAADEDIYIVLETKQFVQTPIAGTNITVLDVKKASKFGMLSIKNNITVVDVLGIGNKTDSNGFAVLKFTPIGGSWQKGDYEITMRINAGNINQTQREWFCIDCGKW